MNTPLALPPAHRTLPPVPGSEPLLRGVNPELKTTGGPLLLGINPELAGADWKRFQGATSDGAVYTPGPSYADVRAGKSELSKGQSGPGVTQLQASLRRSGEKLDVDNYFGPQTEGAVKNFQRKHELPETGVVDAATAKALDAAAPAPKPQPKPAPRPNNGGGGGGRVTPPTPPNVPKLPSNPFAAQAALYDLATNHLQNYQKGSNPAFDVVVQKLLDAPPHVIPAGGDPEYGKMLEAESRFGSAARKAGF